MSIIPAVTVDEFRRRFTEVYARVQAARERSIYQQHVRMLAVTKTVPVPRLEAAIAAGIVDFGENRVQEIEVKATAPPLAKARWAMIGSLQTNKISSVIRYVDELHSLDRLRLAETLNERLLELGKTLKVYVQVNTSGESSKSGLAPTDVAEFVAELPRFKALHPVGFMTMAVLSSDTTAVRDCFVRLRELRDETLEGSAFGAGLRELSMGMSGDFEIAIEEGATVVRLGQALFGSRG